MKITCTSVLDYLKKKFLDQTASEATCNDCSSDKMAGESAFPPSLCSPLGIKHLTKSLTRIDSRPKGPCSCSELNINGRALHYVIRLDDRNASLKFYTDIMGMKILRNEEIRIRECRDDQPFQSKTIVGYGPEDNYFCLQLLYDCKRRNHLKGNECTGLTVIASQALQQAKRSNWPIHPFNMLEAPDGLKIFVVDSPLPQKSDPIIKISFASSNLISSLTFWHSMLGLTLFQNCKVEKRAQIAFRCDEVQIELRQSSVPVNRGESFDRIVFSCPVEQLEEIQSRVSREFEGRVIQPLTKQEHDGLKYIVLADPDGHEVCFVDDLRFRQISRLKPELRIQFGERIKDKRCCQPDPLKSCLKKGGISPNSSCCRSPNSSKYPGRSGIPVLIQGRGCVKPLPQSCGGTGPPPSETPATSDEPSRSFKKDKENSKTTQINTVEPAIQDNDSMVSLLPSKSILSVKSERSVVNTDKPRKKRKSREELDVAKTRRKSHTDPYEEKPSEHKKKKRRKEGNPDDDDQETAEDIILDYLLAEEQVCPCCPMSADSNSAPDGKCCDSPPPEGSSCTPDYFKNCIPKSCQCTPVPPPPPSPPVPPSSNSKEPPKFEQHITLVIKSDKDGKITASDAKVKDGAGKDADINPDDSSSETCIPKSCSPSPSCVSTSRPCEPKPTVIPLISTMGQPLFSPISPDQLRSSVPPVLQYAPPRQQPTSAPKIKPGQRTRSDHSPTSMHQVSFGPTNSVPVVAPAPQGIISVPSETSPTGVYSQPVLSSSNVPSTLSKQELKKQLKQLEKIEKLEKKRSEQIKRDAKRRKSEEKQLEKELDKIEREAMRDERRRRKENRLTEPVMQPVQYETSPYEYASPYQSDPSSQNVTSQSSPNPSHSSVPYPNRPQTHYPALPNNQNIPYVLTQCPPQCQFPEVGKVSPCAELNKRRCPYDSDDSEDIFFNNQFYHRPGHHHHRPEPTGRTAEQPLPPPQPRLLIDERGNRNAPKYAERGPAKVVYKIKADGSGKSSTILRKKPLPPPKRIRSDVLDNDEDVVTAAPVYSASFGKGLNSVTSFQRVPNEVAPVPSRRSVLSRSSLHGPSQSGIIHPVASSQPSNLVVRSRSGKVKMININEEEDKKKKKEEMALYKEMERLRSMERQQDEGRRKELEKHEKKLERERLEIEKEKIKLEREKALEATREKQKMEQEKEKIEREKERVEREKERDYEREKERLQREKERLQKEIEKDKEEIQREREKVALDLERARIKALEADRARARRLIDASRRIKAQEELLTPVSRVGFVSVETTNPHSQTAICDEDICNTKKKEKGNPKDVAKLLESAVKKLENSSIEDTAYSSLVAKRDDKEAQEISKLLKELTKSQKKFGQSNKRPVKTISKKVGSPGRSNTKVPKVVEYTKHMYQVINPTKLSKIETKSKNNTPPILSTSSSLQAYGNAQLAAMTDQLKKIAESMSESPSWRKGQKPSKIPMLDKNKLRMFTDRKKPIIDMTPSDIIEEAMNVPAKSPTNIMKKSLSSYIKRGKSKEQVSAAKMLPPVNLKRSPSQIIEEAMKGPDEKLVMINDQPMEIVEPLPNPTKAIIDEAVTANVNQLPFVQRNDQVTNTVKDQSTNKDLSKIVVNEGTNIDCTDQSTQDDRLVKVDREIQEKVEGAEKCIASDSKSKPLKPCLPEVVRIIQYDSGQSSVSGTVSEVQSSQVLSELAIKEEEEAQIKELIKRLRKEGALKKPERNQHSKITREDIEKKIINEAMARVTSHCEMDILQNISKSIAEKVAGLATSNIKKLLKKSSPKQSAQKIDIKLPEPNVIKLEPRIIEDLQTRLKNLEKNVPLRSQSKQSSKSSLGASGSRKKPPFSQVISISDHSRPKPTIAKAPPLKSPGREVFTVRDFVSSVDTLTSPAICRKYSEQVENAIKDTLNNTCPAPRKVPLSPEERIRNFLQKRASMSIKQANDTMMTSASCSSVSVRQIPGRTLNDKLVVIESKIKSGRASVKSSSKVISSDVQGNSKVKISKNTSFNNISCKRERKSIVESQHPQTKSAKVSAHRVISGRTSSGCESARISPYLQRTLNRIYQDVNGIEAYKRRGSSIFKVPIDNQNDHWKPVYKTNVQQTSTQNLNLDTIKPETVATKLCCTTYDLSNKITNIEETVQPAQKDPAYKHYQVSCSPLFPRSKILLQHPPCKRSNNSDMNVERSSNSSRRKLNIKEKKASIISIENRRDNPYEPIMKGRTSIIELSTATVKEDYLTQALATSTNTPLGSSNNRVCSRTIVSYVPNSDKKDTESQDWVEALNNKTVEILEQSALAVESIRRHSVKKLNTIALYPLNAQTSKVCANDTKDINDIRRSNDKCGAAGSGVHPKREPLELQPFQISVSHEDPKRNHRSIQGVCAPNLVSTATSPKCHYRVTSTLSDDDETEEEEIKTTNLDLRRVSKRCQCRPMENCKKEQRSTNSGRKNPVNLFESSTDLKPHAKVQTTKSRHDKIIYTTTYKPRHTMTKAAQRLMADELRRRLVLIQNQQIDDKYNTSPVMERDILPSTTRDVYTDYDL